MEPKALIDLANILAIILSIVALFITVIGFFASLKFYRDGVKLQASANDTLARIEEKSISIQTQVGGMFDKTLDAALGKSEKLDSSFEALNQQLENTAKAIVDSAQKKIGAAGEEERKKLALIVEKQMEPLRASLEETRERAAQVIETGFSEQQTGGTIELKILELLSGREEQMSSLEISKLLKLPRDRVLFNLRRLVSKGKLVRKAVESIAYYSSSPSK